MFVSVRMSDNGDHCKTSRTYWFIEFSIEFELIFTELGHIDGGTELTTDSFGSGMVKIFPSKVMNAACLHAFPQAFVEL
jgi:hypothetical protein